MKPKGKQTMTDITIDWDRIIQPLRVARGSHQPGSGKGCAMNVVSYITGEATITDLPACSDGDLAVLVHNINDHLGAAADPWKPPAEQMLSRNGKRPSRPCSTPPAHSSPSTAKRPDSTHTPPADSAALEKTLIHQ